MQYIQQYFEFALHIFLFPELTDHTLDLEDDFSGDDVSSGVEDGKPNPPCIYPLALPGDR